MRINIFFELTGVLTQKLFVLVNRDFFCKKTNICLGYCYLCLNWHVNRKKCDFKYFFDKE
jgi:hypothetical protein